MIMVEYSLLEIAKPFNSVTLAHVPPGGFVDRNRLHDHFNSNSRCAWSEEHCFLLMGRQSDTTYEVPELSVLGSSVSIQDARPH